MIADKAGGAGDENSFIDNATSSLFLEVKYC